MIIFSQGGMSLVTLIEILIENTEKSNWLLSYCDEFVSSLVCGYIIKF